VFCLAIVASNLWSMSGWSERRGAADDLCYLRQAHLFQTQGVGGLSTDIAHETDGYFKRLVTEAGHPESNVAGFANCHPKVAATGKIVLRYPPGVGFLLALFFRIGRLPSSRKDPNSTSEMVRPPKIGEQTKERRAEFGFSADAIATLRQGKVV
jgi:hypothetical protein